MKIISSATSLLLIGACGGGAINQVEPKSGDLNAAEFSGVTSLEASGDTWIVKWKTLNADGVVYAIYEGEAENAINYNVSIATTDGNSYTYTPANFYSNEPKCFAVRVVNMTGDDNEITDCISPPPLNFTGLKDTEINSTGNGGWELEWEAVNVEGVRYSIFKGNEGAIDYTAPMGIETNSFFQIKKEDLEIPREQKVCFVVRYEHEDLVADENENELCTPTAPPIDFKGVKDLTALNTLKQIEVNWEKAPQESSASEAEKVIGYIIYAKTDEVLETLIVEDNPPGLSISGNVYSFTTSYDSGTVGEGVPISVKAIDKYYREDSNTCAAIANLNSGNSSSTEDPTSCDTDPTND